ncbi:MAG: glycosylhydrolase-like jelly roll fold domain-containing protein [Planctomycetota bacterium]
MERAEQILVRDNFFICAREVLNAHGLGHRPQAYGRGLSRDLFEAYSNCDVPEIEESVYCPEAVWASHTLGKPITSVEGMTFLSRHVNDLIRPVFGDEQKGYGIGEPRGSWETNPAMLRWFSNAHYARGINRVQIHSFGYSPDGVPLPGWRMYAEIHLNRNVPWWRYMKQYSAWSRRIQWVLQSGRPVADSLVYPVVGDRGDGPHNKRTEQQPVSAMNCIDAADTYTFGRIWESDDNRYEVNHLCLLGDIKTLKEAGKIEQMIRRGAKVTYCGGEPKKWTVFQAHEGPIVDRLSDSIEKARRHGRIADGRKEGWKRVLKKARSVRWYPEDAVLTYLHRRVEGAEVYFVMNCGEEFSGEIEFSERGLVPEIWDADTGRKTVSGQWRRCDGKVRVKVQLGRLESVVLVFTEGEQVLHARWCEGADIIRGDNGKLYALTAKEKGCRVFLSDGRVTNLKAKVPDEINLNEGWTFCASDSDGVGVKGKVEIRLDELKSWRQISKVRNYSGTGSYRIAFDVGPEMLRDDLLVELDLGKVHEVAEVWLNGKRVGVSWYRPYRVDITGCLKEGSNEVRVDVTNILKNYLADDEYSHPSGLLGPVMIQGIAKVLVSE